MKRTNKDSENNRISRLNQVHILNCKEFRLGRSDEKFLTSYMYNMMIIMVDELKKGSIQLLLIFISIPTIMVLIFHIMGLLGDLYTELILALLIIELFYGIRKILKSK